MASGGNCSGSRPCGLPYIDEARGLRNFGRVFFVQALNIVWVTSLDYLEWDYNAFKRYHFYLMPVCTKPAADAGNQITLEVNTRLFSYFIAFYMAPLMVSKLKDAVGKCCIGLF